MSNGLRYDDMMSTPVDPKVWRWATSLVHASRVAQFLSSELDKAGKPAPARWTITSLLVAACILVREKSTVSYLKIMEVLAVRLTPAQLTELGCPDGQHPRRSVQHLRDVAVGARAVRESRADGQLLPPRTQTQLRRDCDAVYQGVYAAAQIVLDVLDSSPVDRKRATTVGAITAAQARLTKAEKGVLKANAERLTTACNMIVAGSIAHLFPDGYTGHTVTDLTVVPTMLDRSHAFSADPDDAPVSHPEANRYVRDRWNKYVQGYGATIVKTHPASHPGVHSSLVLSVHFGKANAGSTEAAVAAIQAGKDSGSISPFTDHKFRLIVTDAGYAANDFKPAMLALGFHQLRRLTKMEREIVPLRDGSGAFIYEGMLFCAGALSMARRHKAYATDGALDDPREKAKRNKMTKKQLRDRRDETLQELAQLQMLPHSQPKETLDRPRGRPRKDAPATVGKGHSTTRGCPAAGAVSCPLKVESGGPKLIGMPSPPPKDDLPRVCKNTYSTLRLTERELRHLMPYDVTSHEYEKYALRGRAADERAHSALKHATGHRADSVYARDKALRSLVVAICLADVNRRIIREYYGTEVSIPATPEDRSA